MSASLYDRAAIIPGRSLTRSKAPGRLFAVDSGGPLYALRGEGAVLYDVDQRPYIDMVCGLGAISLGYRDARYSGTGVYSLPHRDEIHTAEVVLEQVAPWASSVRFLKTGSEATHAAYRIAKRATGRQHVVMGNWAYHGWHEWCDDQAFPFTHRFALGADMDTVANWENTAAVFIEPHRFEPTPLAWLQSVRAFCDRIGALLVFDEMIYGGRWALGGSIACHGVVPDLACYGKAFGNGQSVAFVVGNEALRDHGEIVSGTYSGDVVGLSAVYDTVREYEKADVIATLWARGTQLQRGLDAVVSRYPALRAHREGMPVHQRIRFEDPTLGKRFAAEMARRGVLWHPDVVNVMAAHTPAQIAHVIVAADESGRALITSS